MDIRFGNKAFTYTGEAEVEEYIRKILNEILSILLEKTKPLAVFVYGSLGRGEGTAIHVSGKIIMYSDFEIGYVSNRLSDRKILRTVNQDIETRIGHDITISFFTPRRIRLGANTNFAIRADFEPTIEAYEISNSAYFLYGKDFRNIESYPDTNRIPLWESLRCLFNRMAEFLIANNSQNTNAQIKTINKVKIACGDAILMLDGHYHFSYAQRLCNLKHLESCNKLKIYNLQDELISFIDSGYRWKLFAEHNTLKPSSVELRFLGEVTFKVLRILLYQEMGFKAEKEGDISRYYLSSNKLMKSYYKGISGHPLLQNLRLFLQKRISLNLFIMSIFDKYSLIHKVYSNIIPLFFSQIMRLHCDQDFVLTESEKCLLSLYSDLME